MKKRFNVEDYWGHRTKDIESGLVLKLPDAFFAYHPDTGKKLIFKTNITHCHEQGGSYDIVEWDVLDAETLVKVPLPHEVLLEEDSYE